MSPTRNINFTTKTMSTWAWSTHVASCTIRCNNECDLKITAPCVRRRDHGLEFIVMVARKCQPTAVKVWCAVLGSSIPLNLASWISSGFEFVLRECSIPLRWLDPTHEIWLAQTHDTKHLVLMSITVMRCNATESEPKFTSNASDCGSLTLSKCKRTKRKQPWAI